MNVQRTPDNLYPNENALNPAEGWDCTDFLQFNYGGGGPSAHVYHETYTPPEHPFISQIWNGTCDAGQLTRGGLEDAVKHGKVNEVRLLRYNPTLIHGKQDFWSVYHGKLGFLQHVDERELYIRTSTETRTHQVAGGFLFGMDRSMLDRSFKIHTQPANVGTIIRHCFASTACPKVVARSTPWCRGTLVRRPTTSGTHIRRFLRGRITSSRTQTCSTDWTRHWGLAVRVLGQAGVSIQVLLNCNESTLIDAPQTTTSSTLSRRGHAMVIPYHAIQVELASPKKMRTECMLWVTGSTSELGYFTLTVHDTDTLDC